MSEPNIRAIAPDNLSDTLHQVKEIQRRISESLAVLEAKEHKIEEWRVETERTVGEKINQMHQMLTQITQASQHVESVTTEMGIQRYRLVLEENLKLGKDHLKALEVQTQKHEEMIKHCHDDFLKTAQQVFERLNRASAYVIKNISEAVGSFRLSDFQRLTEQSCDRVEETSVTVMERLKDSVRWFHWKNLVLASFFAIVSSVITGLYLNDEMPWEIHKTVMDQRHAGIALMNAWPALSQNERQRIIEHSKEDVL